MRPDVDALLYLTQKGLQKCERVFGAMEGVQLKDLPGVLRMPCRRMDGEEVKQRPVVGPG